MPALLGDVADIWIFSAVARGHGSIDAIMAATGLPRPDILGRLARLMLRGLVRPSPQLVFALTAAGQKFQRNGGLL